MPAYMEPCGFDCMRPKQRFWCCEMCGKVFVRYFGPESFVTDGFHDCINGYVEAKEPDWGKR